MEERAAYVVDRPDRDIEITVQLSEKRLMRVDSIARQLGIARDEMIATMIDGFDWASD